MALGIDKIQVCLKASKGLVDSAFVVMADGKIGISDITEVPELFSKFSLLASAGPEALEQAKDIDLAEAKQLLGEALEVLMYVASKFEKKAV